ncbi:MAG: hypothetical protein CMG10_04835 [Candidatus Marinimicrobia bacterium]|nr:hypothetical protein [Candidatus Neomarinimicrobiota bacterium]
MEMKNLNMYQRLRDFDVPAVVLDEIFSNKEDLAILKKAWQDLSTEEMNHDEVAKSIARVILEELGEDFIQSLSDTSEK